MYFNDLFVYCSFIFDFWWDFWKWNFFSSMVVCIFFIGFEEMVIVVFGFEFYFVKNINKFF